jgi:hypothetical protein
MVTVLVQAGLVVAGVVAQVTTNRVMVAGVTAPRHPSVTHHHLDKGDNGDEEGNYNGDQHGNEGVGGVWWQQQQQQ